MSIDHPLLQALFGTIDFFVAVVWGVVAFILGYLTRSKIIESKPSTENPSEINKTSDTTELELDVEPIIEEIDEYIWIKDSYSTIANKIEAEIERQTRAWDNDSDLAVAAELSYELLNSDKGDDELPIDPETLGMLQISDFGELNEDQSSTDSSDLAPDIEMEKDNELEGPQEQDNDDQN